MHPGLRQGGEHMTRISKSNNVIGNRDGANCDELLALLNDYVDGNVDPSICIALKAHLEGCNPCKVVVDNVRKTITLYRKDKPCELPIEFGNRLHAALRDCWKETTRAKAGRSRKPAKS